MLYQGDSIYALHLYCSLVFILYQDTSLCQAGWN